VKIYVPGRHGTHPLVEGSERTTSDLGEKAVTSSSQTDGPYLCPFPPHPSDLPFFWLLLPSFASSTLL